MDRKTKEQLGKFYTVKSPFKGEAWDVFKNVFNKEDIILEPFAGSNNIPKMIDDIKNKWISYDIFPEDDNVFKRDSINDFPANYRVCITNPPYLDARTARKKNLHFESKYSDMYLESLDKILSNTHYVAAIIPASFINNSFFKERLWMWDKIDKNIFSDTGMAVGVAYFSNTCVDEINKKYFLNGQEIKIKTNPKIKNSITVFNTKSANIAIKLIDSTKNKDISFFSIADFDFKKHLKISSRHYVCLLDERLSELDIINLNLYIEKWRKETNDYYLTPFKSTLPDGSFRKRMSFAQVGRLIENYIKERNS